MKKSMLLIAILFTTGCASHDPWTRKDTYRHAAMTGLMIIDWRQTRQIADNPDEYYEAGPAKWFIGEHPTTSEVDWYFGLSWLFKTQISRALSTKYRPWWQYLCVGTSAGCVVNNYSIRLQGEW